MFLEGERFSSLVTLVVAPEVIGKRVNWLSKFQRSDDLQGDRSGKLIFRHLEERSAARVKIGSMIVDTYEEQYCGDYLNRQLTVPYRTSCIMILLKFQVLCFRMLKVHTAEVQAILNRQSSLRLSPRPSDLVAHARIWCHRTHAARKGEPNYRQEGRYCCR